MNRKINRYGSYSSKWDEPQKNFSHEDMIHMSVADMDLEISPSIQEAIINKTKRGVLGYTYFSQDAKDDIVYWIKKRHDVTICSDWIVFIPRVSIAASIFVESLTGVEDKIVLNSPTYPPLKYAVSSNYRQIINNPLVRVSDSWKMDFTKLEDLIDHKTKAMILVNPDNPSGRSWSHEELERLSQIIVKHDLLLFSDEVHSDIINTSETHTTTLNLSTELNERLIYAGSISKTFNVPGLMISYLIIPNEEIRKTFNQEIKRIGMNNPPVYTNEVINAAFRHSDHWLEKTLEQINSNEQLLLKTVTEKMPKLNVLKREATYLSLIDFSKFNIEDNNILKWFEKEAHLTVYSGLHFGSYGEKLVRLNLATDTDTFSEAIERMVSNYDKIKEYENESI